MVLGVVLACVVFAAGANAGELDIDNAPPPPENEQAIRDAVARGLDYLAKSQNKDGSWGTGSYSRDVAVTGLAAMALMSQGNVGNRGKYGKNVTDGIEFILRNVNQHSGFIGNGPSSRMYHHGFATLALAEALGMDHSELLEDRLRKAVRLIIRSQKPDGGWRYDPSPTGMSDLSVTVCQVMALRAARNAGVKVPKEVIDRAVEYVKKSANEDGSFRYMLNQASGKSYALTGAGVTTLFGAGEYDTPEIEAGLDYLMRGAGGNFGHYYYGQYYAAQAMYFAGGDMFREWYAKVSKELLARQQQDGSWSGEINEAYATAMSCLVLQIHNCYLPIFQK